MARRNASGPIRRCIVCREPAGKWTLHRLVRAPDGSIADDPTGKAPGRGAYLCGASACVESASRRRAVARALRTTRVTDADIALDALTKRLRPMHRK
jgi:predicted RNA-binding protein YlxR (DUF448 family)